MGKAREGSVDDTRQWLRRQKEDRQKTSTSTWMPRRVPWRPVLVLSGLAPVLALLFVLGDKKEPGGAHDPRASSLGVLQRKLDCVASRGSWVHQPTPRALPWPRLEPWFTGPGSCDRRWLQHSQNGVEEPEVHQRWLQQQHREGDKGALEAGHNPGQSGGEASGQGDDLEGSPGSSEGSAPAARVLSVKKGDENIAGPEADAVTDPAQWRVRESLKYQWEAPGDCRDAWAGFDGDRFSRALLRRLNGSLLVVGDSLSLHMFWSLHAHLDAWCRGRQGGTPQDRHEGDSQARHGADSEGRHGDGLQDTYGGDPQTSDKRRRRGLESKLLESVNGASSASLVTPEPCKTWEEMGLISQKKFPLCKAISSCEAGSQEQPHAAGGQPHAAYFCRNDRLSLDTVPPGRTNETKVFRNRLFLMPWMSLIKAWNVKAVLLNTGAHAVKDEEFEMNLEQALSAVRERYPDVILMYRASVPGHLHCENITRPLESRQNLADLPFNWQPMHGQNEIARAAVGRHGGLFLDVDWMTSLRADGHVGYHKQKHDCLHYCIPGPMDAWVQMLYNAIINVFD